MTLSTHHSLTGFLRQRRGTMQSLWWIPLRSQLATVETEPSWSYKIAGSRAEEFGALPTDLNL